MNKMLASIGFLLTLTAAPAFAAIPANVGSCAEDTYTSERIREYVPTQEQLKVYNVKGEIVGVFHYDPPTGDLHALYLCGTNDGYYYAKGNATDRSVYAIYNDEYDTELTTENLPGGMKISFSMKFSGEEESADYGPFSDTIYVKIP